MDTQIKSITAFRFSDSSEQSYTLVLLHGAFLDIFEQYWLCCMLESRKHLQVRLVRWV